MSHKVEGSGSPFHEIAIVKCVTLEYIENETSICFGCVIYVSRLSVFCLENPNIDILTFLIDKIIKANLEFGLIFAGFDFFKIALERVNPNEHDSY